MILKNRLRSELLFTVFVSLVASAIAAVVAVRVGGATHPQDSLTTRVLTLVDNNNQPIAVLSSKQGSPELAFLDQQHRKRSALFLETNGTPDLYLYDAAGNARASLDLYDSGAPNLALVGEAGGVNQPVIIFESKSEASARFVFYDFRRSRAPQLGTFEFSLVDNRPTLQLLDASGKRLWKAP